MNWPNEFEYISAFNGETYSAKKDEDGTYTITSNDRWGVPVTRSGIKAKEFDVALSESKIKITYNLLDIIKEPPEAEETEYIATSQLRPRQINLNVNDAYAAAKFDYENNPHTKASGVPFQEVLDDIHNMMLRVYTEAMESEDFHRITLSTRSYMVEFYPEDVDYGMIRVKVEPSVGMMSYYVDAAQYFDQAI
jgi:hypothetical protein